MSGLVKHVTEFDRSRGSGGDLLRREKLPCSMIPVTITSGDEAHPSRSGYHVPKRELLTGLQVLAQQGGQGFRGNCC